MTNIQYIRLLSDIEFRNFLKWIYEDGNSDGQSEEYDKNYEQINMEWLLNEQDKEFWEWFHEYNHSTN